MQLSYIIILWSKHVSLTDHTKLYVLFAKDPLFNEAERAVSKNTIHLNVQKVQKLCLQESMHYVM